MPGDAKFWYHKERSLPNPKKEIFVFGSNLAGRHGKGAALVAREKFGAVYGQAVGLQGRSYAIPTKDKDLKTLPLHVIKTYVDELIAYVPRHRSLVGKDRFFVTMIGCGLAGYDPRQIAPFFRFVNPDWYSFSTEFGPWLEPDSHTPKVVIKDLFSK